MKRFTAWAIVGGPILAVAIGVWVARGHVPRQTQPLPSGVLGGANVLLVTIDTLRADRVGAYGSDRGLTPAIDRFARTGLRFDRTYAHVPLTLPSHTSLMTASYPPHNAVRDNGTFRLGDSPTLASALKGAGYRTAAFVGAFVLDARFGLNRGFDVYDDRMLGSSADLDVVQRSAEQVLDPAYDWIASPAAQRTPGPWFAWVHLYDPHEPYTPPEPFRTQYAAAPYEGEIAYADAALGRFAERLQTDGILAHTLVVIVSDHGESLGEHDERTHGLFAYDATLRVPLIFWANGRIRPGVVDDTMRLIDVAPTILDLVGTLPLARVDGRSVRPFITGERPFDDTGSYFEAMNANLTRGWAPLTGMLRQHMKLIDLPIPELYDLAADAGETRNLYATERDRARDLEQRLDAVVKDAAPAAPSSIDADAEARLRSLGYVVGSRPAADRRYTAADDPKTLVHLNQALDDAAARWGRGDAQGAIEELRAVIKERSDLVAAYDRLAFMLRASGRIPEAITVLDDAARNGHADPSLLRSLGSMLRDAGDLRRSAAVLEALVKDDPSDLQSTDALAQTYTRMGRGVEAEALFRRVIAASPHAAATWSNLGSLFIVEHRMADAVDALSRAVEMNPDLATAHNGLGVALAAQGQMDRAVKEWQTALALRPGYPDAQSNLDRVRR
jgi:arylsulfatase A-like enzyme/Flp pilus assembly protein TadD